MADTPEAYYRNALDLNRFGNKVQNDLRKSYNRIIVDAVEKLARINEMPLERRPKYKTARLRALLKQTTESLARWSGKSEKTVIKELQGLAKVQVDFAVNQLEAALPAGLRNSVNSVEVSPSYAKSVVTKKATDLNASLLSDNLEAKVKGVPQRFSLTAKQGSQITLPNGEILTKAFRGLAAKQADLFGRNILDGLMTGETTQEMTRRLYGLLKFEGGAKMTNNQISVLVKTSVQSVSNQAAQTVYEANQDITKQYKWIATLDSRTAPECRILDQTVHNYGQGPEPPQHFGCRCRTTAVLDYEALGVDPPKYKYVKRAGEGGSVPIGTSYGKWLSKQSASYKAKALGQSKVKYFNALTKKYGPDKALKKLVREDGSAKTLQQLERAYGKSPSKMIPKSVKERPKAPQSWQRYSNGSLEKRAEPSEATLWTKDRQKLHDKIVNEVLMENNPQPQKSPQFFMTGGGSASGKSIMLKKSPLPKGTVVIDPDELKKKLPEFNQMLKAGGTQMKQAAAYVHEESSYLSKRIMREAAKNKYNTMLDGTGDNSLKSLTKKVQQMKDRGMTVRAKYATADIQTALERSHARAIKTGRDVPYPSVVTLHQNVSRVVPDALQAGIFDEFELYDMNKSGTAIRVALYTKADGLVIEKPELWNNFLGKAWQPMSKFQKWMDTH